jgi:hypothetical protein
MGTPKKKSTATGRRKVRGGGAKAPAQPAADTKRRCIHSRLPTPPALNVGEAAGVDAQHVGSAGGGSGATGAAFASSALSPLSAEETEEEEAAVEGEDNSEEAMRVHPPAPDALLLLLLQSGEPEREPEKAAVLEAAMAERELAMAQREASMAQREAAHQAVRDALETEAASEAEALEAAIKERELAMEERELAITEREAALSEALEAAKAYRKATELQRDALESEAAAAQEAMRSCIDRLAAVSGPSSHWEPSAHASLMAV